MIIVLLWERDGDQGIHNLVSYTLSREYQAVRNRYSWLLFTSADRLCANFRVQEQSMNMKSVKTFLGENELFVREIK